MKILLIAGHGNGDPGAVGNGYKEADLTREVVALLKPKLEPYCTLDIASTTTNWFEYLGNHAYNFKSYDYVLEVHFNSGGGHGTEIYVTTSETGTTVETDIVNAVASVGLTNRGVKRKNFRVISRVKAQGVSAALLEVCFIDSAADMAVWKSKKDAIVQAIADGVIKGFNLKGADEMTGEERTKFNLLVEEVADLRNKVDELAKPEMIYNYIDKNIHSWAVDAVTWAKNSNIIEGDENGMLQLNGVKLWVLVVLYRAARWICKQVNVKI